MQPILGQVLSMVSINNTLLKMNRRRKNMQLNLVKKITISIALLAGTFCSMTLKTYADSIKIDSQNIPQQAIDSVKEQWQELTFSKVTQDNKKITDYYLGTPFSIKNETSSSYQFPIINKNTNDIEYTIELPANENYDSASLIISEKKAEVIDKLSKTLDTQDHPIELYQNHYEIKYLYKNNSYTLLKSSVHNSDNQDIQRPTETTTKVVEITDELAVPTHYLYRRSMPELQQKILQWHPFELQTNIPICYLYCLSEVANNQLGKFDLTAVDLAKATYPGITDEELLSGSRVMYVEDTLAYLNKKYSQNIKFNKSLLPFSDLKKEIDSDSPVVVDLQNLTQDDGKHNHALTMIGYTMTADGDVTTNPPYYTYWNPWWTETFMVSSKSEKLTLDNSIYKPYRTTYNFHIK